MYLAKKEITVNRGINYKPCLLERVLFANEHPFDSIGSISCIIEIDGVKDLELVVKLHGIECFDESGNLLRISAREEKELKNLIKKSLTFKF